MVVHPESLIASQPLRELRLISAKLQVPMVAEMPQRDSALILCNFQCVFQDVICVLLRRAAFCFFRQRPQRALAFSNGSAESFFRASGGYLKFCVNQPLRSHELVKQESRSIYEIRRNHRDDGWFPVARPDNTFPDLQGECRDSQQKNDHLLFAPPPSFFQNAAKNCAIIRLRQVVPFLARPRIGPLILSCGLFLRTPLFVVSIPLRIDSRCPCP